MKKSLFILFISILSTFCVKADILADWSIHMPFDNWANQVIETPKRVYFTSRTFEDAANITGRDISSNSLFYYDKEGDEIVSMNERTNASGNAVACIGYNAHKHYLLVVYTDCNIDFIYDDGRIYNLQALKATSIPGIKEVNYINFDTARNRVYLATSFGYVVLNEDKHEVSESRNYGISIQSIARCGDNMVLCTEGKLYHAPIAGQRFNFTDYTLIGESLPEFTGIIPSPNPHFFAYKKGYNTYLYIFRVNDEGEYEPQRINEENLFYGVQTVEGGHRLTGDVRMYYLLDGGNYPAVTRPSVISGNPSSSLTGNELWVLNPKQGLRSYRIDGDKWTLTRDFMRPNSPATYISTSLYYHPTYGMLAGSNGFDIALSNFNQRTPNNISALKDGFWKEYGPNYASDVKLTSTNNYSGLAVDPQNINHVYRASTLGGLMRINLSNPSDIMVFANPSNPNSGNPGFVEIVEDQAAWNILCRFTTPSFAADGTMWTLFYNRNKERGELWYWPAADRLSTTGAASYRPMKSITLPLWPAGNSDEITTLTKNKNIIAIAGFGGGGTVMFYDHKGTPDVTSDDRYVHLTDLYDQDGGGVAFQAVNKLREDPATGLVWILSQRGVFTVNPATVFEDPTRVNRIKVARNDGTNLADYLLNEINVFDMVIDGEGRKWFTTSNGIVCTSQDGRQILGEFTTENSYLPSDVVYTACFNPENNSLMVATDGGLVEMFPSGSGSSSADAGSEMRVYPNPVEPDFYGWVRIDNIADGSLVKITDSKGGLVKELGPAQGGSVQWDVSGLNNSRVSTGVYYIMVSPGSSGNGKAQIAKILVLN